MLFRGIRWLMKSLRLKLSGVVGIVATGFAVLHHYVVTKLVLNGILSQHSMTAWLCRPIYLLGWHAVGVGYAVSLASSSMLACQTTWLLGKQQDGSIDPVRYCIGYPYQVGIQTKLFLERSHGDEPVYDEIIPRVFLGGWPAHPALLPVDTSPSKAGMGRKIAVVDVTCELPCRVRDDIDAYHLVPVWDSHAPSVDQIQRAIEWTLPYLDDDTYIVYVHCAHGHGRSATIVGAILIATGVVDTVDQAIKCMTKQRPLVRLNSRQRDALLMWTQTSRRGR